MCSHAHRLNNRLAGQVELLYFHGERFPLLLCQTVLFVLFTASSLLQGGQGQLKPPSVWPSGGLWSAYTGWLVNTTDSQQYKILQYR